MELGYLGKLKFSDKRIDLIKQYVKDGTFPDDTSADVKKAIRRQYKDNDEFEVVNDKLIYKKSNQKIHLIVVLTFNYSLFNKILIKNVK